MLPEGMRYASMRNVRMRSHTTIATRSAFVHSLSSVREPGSSERRLIAAR